MKVLLYISVFILLLACGDKGANYTAYKKTQDYTVPLFNVADTNKTAMFVFPHPDDEIVCTGAMHKLKTLGWKICLLTLTKGTEKEQRSEEWRNAVEQMDIEQAVLLDFPNNKWEDVMKDSIQFWYTNSDSIQQTIRRKTNEWKPSLIFTYDTAIGGYGHPEHRLTALAAYKVFAGYTKNDAYAPERILQITLPEQMEAMMLKNSDAYSLAKKRTGNTGLPDPTVAFDIRNDWSFKQAAASQYTSQVKTLKKFMLLAESADSIEHYNTFDREYYFEIKR
jgi:LmbE family N-acetylglucosaminyl deacetylase